MIQLSVLDQSIAAAGSSQDQAVRNTLALAQHCEAWGYRRFWVSEHHSHPSIVGTAPEVLMAAIAARPQRIRIGSAGVMLPHYTAYKVAEQFRDCERGAVTPFGRLYGLTTLLDDSIAPDTLIVFEAERHAVAIRMRCHDFEKLEEPQTNAF